MQKGKENHRTLAKKLIQKREIEVLLSDGKDCCLSLSRISHRTTSLMATPYSVGMTCSGPYIRPAIETTTLLQLSDYTLCVMSLLIMTLYICKSQYFICL